MAVAHSLPRRAVARRSEQRQTRVWSTRSVARPRSTPGGTLGVIILSLLLLGAAFGPLLWPVDPQAQDLVNRLAPPLGFGGTTAHPLGTDTLGRDSLALLIAGVRVSLPLAIGATAAACGVGVALGLLAGFRGGWANRIVSWLADVQLAIPFVVFAIVITVMIGNSVTNVLVTLIVTGWVVYAQVVGLQARRLRSAEWVEAARTIGAAPPRVLVCHVLPNVAGTAIVLATQQAGAMILYESSLSFLGLGVGGNTVTWGGMAALGRDAIFKAPWVAALPGFAIALAILGFNLTGDWLATRQRIGR